jgi:hypothetical protein
MVGKQGRRSYSGQLEVILHYFSRYPRQESLEGVSPLWNCPVAWFPVLAACWSTARSVAGRDT